MQLRRSIQRVSLTVNTSERQQRTGPDFLRAPHHRHERKSGCSRPALEGGAARSVSPEPQEWADAGRPAQALFAAGAEGAEWSFRQDPALQRAVLGPGKFDLFAAGAQRLSDLVDEHDDPIWRPQVLGEGARAGAELAG